MPQTVLIVDDDPATLQGLAALVEGTGRSVVAASDFAEGRRLLMQLAVDLVVVDVRLGAYNGLQLLVVSKSLPSPPAAIVTSGFDDPVLEAEARRLDAPFVLKPIHPSRLLDLIDELLVRRRPNRENGSPATS